MTLLIEQIKTLQGEKQDTTGGDLVWDICRVSVVCSEDAELPLLLSQDTWMFGSSNVVRWIPAGYAEFFKLRSQGYSVSWAGAKVTQLSTCASWFLSSVLGLPDY